LLQVVLVEQQAAAPVAAVAGKVTALAADMASAAAPPVTEPAAWVVALLPRMQAIPHCA